MSALGLSQWGGETLHRWHVCSPCILESPMALRASQRRMHGNALQGAGTATPICWCTTFASHNAARAWERTGGSSRTLAAGTTRSIDTEPEKLGTRRLALLLGPGPAGGPGYGRGGP